VTANSAAIGFPILDNDAPDAMTEAMRTGARALPRVSALCILELVAVLQSLRGRTDCVGGGDFCAEALESDRGRGRDYLVFWLAVGESPLMRGDSWLSVT
jgi:hypothetical protein